MLRCIVPLQFVSYSFSLLRLEHFIQGPYPMYVQVVSDQHHTLNFRKVLIYHLLELSSEANPCALLRHLDPSPPSQRLTCHKDVGRTFPSVLIVFNSLNSRLCRQWRSRRIVRTQLLALLVHAHYWSKRVVWSLVDGEHIF